MRLITVRIIGTCCFVDRPIGNNAIAFVKRVVIPKDPLVGADRHIPFIELQADHIASGSGDLTATYTHLNGGKIPYRRFELSGHVIAVSEIDPIELTPFDSYEDHVPKMLAVAPGLESEPRDECFAEYPAADLISGFFDISAGLLKAGPLYEFMTKFQSTSNPNPTLSLQTTTFAELLLPVSTTEPLKITITKPNANPIVVVMKSTADVITIGNATLTDLLGGNSNDDVAGHFKLYYKLAKEGTAPQDPPLPVKVQDPVNSCTVTNWP